jgi:antitoxin component of MazEF toxin-antitoxin module
MDAVKIRKQGNSLAVTIDQQTLAAARLREGDLVVPSVQKGLIVLTPVEVRPRVRSKVLEVGRKVISENRRALNRLA